ncbi:uncharacterized protein LOC125715604 isoform X1 [Brienomyrus brachyistius]|uniref:uncharacterized protein LOC125715604 isoform X1 n=1 Tax=Brienomyrus brachyistius TaxID=42636 RepID=UPI0020B25E93|nr:uncharacterized protein LOC125715604 isoform X1 [Brienomyrus brachyistius]XP_048843321.1 uncharacterized protein LOC125715604 isoform X2 [Brienomyrus brachyistius]XP_048843322.1 uncharacterized protein LOC125715604 isoform X1 [Brienomyrus brachyistius]XP_048843323.1 uncharacterized protein LOC125715604 isoform X1 [Brienomyrus brachyistius]XP_048843324.1 uncharacterized protein LOC125715604 isoform X1 [Brienomyrus brachyistius]
MEYQLMGIAMPQDPTYFDIEEFWGRMSSIKNKYRILISRWSKIYTYAVGKHHKKRITTVLFGSFKSAPFYENRRRKTTRRFPLCKQRISKLWNSKTTEVKGGEFKLRTAEEHQGHVKLATEKEKKETHKCLEPLKDKFDAMATSAKLSQVILGENNYERLNLPAGIADSLNDLKKEIQTQLGVLEDFRFQLKDLDFNEFVNLSSTSDLQDRATLKIIFLPTSTSTSSSSVPKQSETSSVSSYDTDIISSPSSVLSTESASSVRRQAWPNTFPIPQFSFDAEIQLQKAQLAYQTDDTVLSPNS